jgi:hypothetical protein
MLEFLRGASGRSLREVLAGIDGSYPPLLHVLTLIPGAVLGHRVEDLAWWPGPWILLLGLAVAGVARAWSDGEGSHWAGPISGALVMGIPAVQLSATRYYYDLPMTALLWAALALVAMRRGALGGVLLAAAALTKWTALPFGLVLLGSLLLLPGRFPAVVRAILSWSSCLGLWFLLRGGMGSLIQMVTTFLPQDADVREGLREPSVLSVVQGSADRLLSVQWLHVGLRFRWHWATLITAVLSPLFSAALVVLAVGRRAPLRPVLFALSVCIGQWFFLAWLIPVHDQRFMLTAAPALVLPVALAVARGPHPAREACALLLLAALVGIEASFGPRAPWNRPTEVLAGRSPSQRVEARGVFLTSSVDGRGWWRGDDTPPGCTEDRARVWAAVLGAAPSLLGTDDRGVLMGARAGSNWLGHESAAARILDGVPLRGARHVQAVPQGAVDLFVMPEDLGAPGPAVQRDPSQWTPLGRLAGTCGNVVLWSLTSPPGPTGPPRGS